MVMFPQYPFYLATADAAGRDIIPTVLIRIVVFPQGDPPAMVGMSFAFRIGCA
jgi:hypothetical protein